MDVCLRCSAFVVRARQLLGGAVGTLCDQGVQQRDVDRGVPAAATRRGEHRPAVAAPWTQRTNVLMWTEKRAATSAYVSALPSYACTARSRSAIGYGFGMRVIDHRSITNCRVESRRGDGSEGE